MPSEQPNTRRIEELKKQIEQAEKDGRDTSQMQAELDNLEGKGQGGGQSQRQGQGQQGGEQRR